MARLIGGTGVSSFIRFFCKNMSDIEVVDISPNGAFKYILLSISGGNLNKSRHIVRGYDSATWHADIFDMVEDKLKRQKIQCECLGGGKITHKSDKKQIDIYGVSQAFGRADHQITASLLKEKYPDYKISVTD